MSNEKRNTPLMELRKQIKERIKHDSENKDVKFIEGQINGLEIVLDMIDQLLSTEKEVIKEAFKQGHEDGYNFEGSRHDYEADGLEEYLSETYFNETFNQIEQ